MHNTTHLEPDSRESHLLPVREFLKGVPYWLVTAIILGLVFVWIILTNADYATIFDAVKKGVIVTIQVTIVAYAASLTLGLMVALARLSNKRLINEVATFYVEIIRGIPMLVLLYYIVFVGVPVTVQFINGIGAFLQDTGVFTGLGDALSSLQVRAVSFQLRVIIALTIGYSAFLSEVFRAGIESIEQGQIEAARSLGMTHFQALRFVILPQAIRRVLPPLGNNFIAMLKDSSLVSVMGVADITFQGKVYAASTFKFFETYNVVAFLYLVMTIALALAVRRMEGRMKTSEK
ncbi:MAG: amino acid ABC transporter permease [Chloroflexi bacterium]|nr:amino acid ABC transporter permease [Chloroflexota bacterium]